MIADVPDKKPMRTGEGRHGVARRRAARMALALLAALLALSPPGASASPSRPLPQGPRFVKFGPSARTVLVWQAVSHSQSGRFLLLRGSEARGLRVAAILPAFEGSHHYRYVDRELPADVETVYQLVYKDDGSELVLVTARVERDGLSSPGAVPGPGRSTDPGRVVDPQLLLPSPALGRPPVTAQRESGERPEPPNPPPKPPTPS